MTTHASVYVTCPDMESAKRLARVLLERRLVACANVLPITSLYRWEGALQEENEVAMFLKTRQALVEQVVAAVAELHPYEVPCAVALPLGAGTPSYYGWIDDETAAPR